MLLLLAFALPCIVALVLRARTPRGGSGPLDARYAPVVVGLAWAALEWFTWGSLHPMPLDHDELSYLLQAEIFAHGRWAVEAPPLPDFFGQAHVLVTPVLASKYPPGHSLLLTLGALVGMPAVVVFLLNAARVGFVFTLARRASDAATALLTCTLLLTGAIVVRFSASYYSETTSGALLLVAWYCLWRWHEGSRRPWLLGVALALGWCAITRPWSALAFALPIGVVVLREVRRTRRWRDLALAMAIGTCIVAILPLWSWRTLGDWRRAPLAEYARDYMPFDYPHFGTVSAAPRLTPPPDVAATNASLLAIERRHTLSNVGPDAVARAEALWRGAWPEPPVLFAGLTLIGLVVLPAAAWLGVATLVMLFVMYLAHPTWPQLNVYYFDVVPVLTFAGALGFTTVLRALAGQQSSRVPRVPAPHAVRAALVACALLLPTVFTTGGLMRRWLHLSAWERTRFERRVAELPGGLAIVFVRHGPRHSPSRSLVVNRADWQTAFAWIVYDRGAENERLRALARGRRAYLYDERQDRFVEMGAVAKVALRANSASAQRGPTP
ncbi:MAG: glycosyltransferase family 39 protein [Gemmatimonadaceae bacterium]